MNNNIQMGFSCVSQIYIPTFQSSPSFPFRTNSNHQYYSTSSNQTMSADSPIRLNPRWDVKHPKTVLLKSWERAKNDIAHFLTQEPHGNAGTRLAHIEGQHGSGKSTGMIEFIYKESHASDPGSTVIYVPSFGLEAMMLSAYFESEASPYDALKQSTCYGVETVEPKLHLATAAQLRAALRGVLRTNTPRKVILLMDLELSPTTDGELLLSEVVAWYQELPPGTSLTLITMATFSRPPVHEFMESQLKTKCRYIVFHLFPLHSLTSRLLLLPTTWLLEDDPSVPESISKVIQDSLSETPAIEANRLIQIHQNDLDQRMKGLDGAAAVAEAIKGMNDNIRLTRDHASGSTVVVIQSTDDAYQISDMLDKHPESDPIHYSISAESTFYDWLQVILHVGPMVVSIDPNVPGVLYIPRVTAIISLPACPMNRFDPDTCTLAWMESPRSRMGFLQEQSYARKSIPWKNHGLVNFLCVHRGDGHLSDETFDGWALAPPAPAYEVQFMRTCLELCVPWPNDAGRMIPLLPVPDITQVEKLWRCLRNMDYLDNHLSFDHRPALRQSQAKQVFEFLGPRYNKLGSVPVASLFLKVQGADSEAIKRVLIRMASLLCECPSPVIYSDQLLEKRDRMDLLTNDEPAYRDCVRDIRKTMALECAGIGKQEFESGAAWTMLGVFLRMEASLMQGKDPNAEHESSNAFMDPTTFFRIFAKVRRVESIHGLKPSEDPIKDTMLRPDETYAVGSVLMLSWSSQLVYFNRKSGRTCKSLVSHRNLVPHEFPHIDADEAFEQDASVKTDLIFAFYTHLFVRDNRPLVFGLTKVPTEFAVRWFRSHGFQSFMVY
ncbi:hypothetical protein F4774DRAFT_384503 [Daldinia eschscholtzii]|nr:hypothetical protein F4774DRAFT_384503 [Daldinia eschscholtzii]